MSKKIDRDYQAEILAESKKLMKESDEPFVIHAYVGAGKSYLAARLAEYLAKFGMKTLVLARQARLIQQNSEEAWGIGLRNSIYSASLTKSTHFPIVYGTEGTIVNAIAEGGDFHDDSDFIKKHGGFDLITYDESHLWPYDNQDSDCMRIYAHFKRLNPKMRMIGMTGSPYRGQELIYPEAGWDKSRYFWQKATEADAGRDRLVKEKWLVDVEYGLHTTEDSYDFSELDVIADKKTGGNFDEEKMDEILQGDWKTTFSICQRVHEKGQTHDLGVLIFASSKFHTEQVKAGLIQAGAKEEEIKIVLDSTPETERDKLCKDIAAGAVKYFINISVASTGWDIARLGHIVYMRPVRSLAFLVQSMGRGLRAYLSKEMIIPFNVDSTKESRAEILAASDKPFCMVDDYAGVMEALGHLLDDARFEEAQEKRDKEDGETKPCPKCDSLGLIHENGQHAVRCSNIINGMRCDYFYSAITCPKTSCKAENAPSAKSCRVCGSNMKDPNAALLNKVYSDNEFRPCTKMTIEPNKAMTGFVVEWHLLEPDQNLGRVKKHFSIQNPIGKRIWYNEIIKKYIKDSSWQSRAYKMGVKGIISAKAMFDQPIEVAVRKNESGEYLVRPKFRVTGVAE